MTARAKIGAFERFAALAVLLAAATCGFAAFVGLSATAPTLAGAVSLDVRDASVRVFRHGTEVSDASAALEFGDRLTVVSGEPIVRAPGGSVQLQKGAEVQVGLPLRIDRASATARGDGFALDLNGVTAVVNGVVQIERGYTTRLSVVSGSVVVESHGRTMELGAQREVVVPAPGLLPPTSHAIGGDASVATGSGNTVLSALAQPGDAAHGEQTTTAGLSGPVEPPKVVTDEVPAEDAAASTPLVTTTVDDVDALATSVLGLLRRE